MMPIETSNSSYLLEKRPETLTNHLSATEALDIVKALEIFTALSSDSGIEDEFELRVLTIELLNENIADEVTEAWSNILSDHVAFGNTKEAKSFFSELSGWVTTRAKTRP